jgi:hypothetical protein
MADRYGELARAALTGKEPTCETLAADVAIGWDDDHGYSASETAFGELVALLRAAAKDAQLRALDHVLSGLCSDPECIRLNVEKLRSAIERGEDV